MEHEMEVYHAVEKSIDLSQDIEKYINLKNNFKQELVSHKEFWEFFSACSTIITVLFFIFSLCNISFGNIGFGTYLMLGLVFLLSPLALASFFVMNPKPINKKSLWSRFVGNFTKNILKKEKVLNNTEQKLKEQTFFMKEKSAQDSVEIFFQDNNPGIYDTKTLKHLKKYKKFRDYIKKGDFILATGIVGKYAKKHMAKEESITKYL